MRRERLTPSHHIQIARIVYSLLKITEREPSVNHGLTEVKDQGFVQICSTARCVEDVEPEKDGDLD